MRRAKARENPMGNSELSEAELHMSGRRIRNEFQRMQRSCPYRDGDPEFPECDHEDNSLWTRDCESGVCPYINAGRQEKENL